jgi:hypothetical protein
VFEDECGGDGGRCDNRDFAESWALCRPVREATKSHTFSDALFWMRAVAPSVGLFSKLGTKPTKPLIDLPP